MSDNKALTVGDKASCPTCNTPLTPAIEGSSNVFINGKPAMRAGDSYAPGFCPVCLTSVPSRKLERGSSSVFINGIPAGRIGDGLSGGGVIIGGSSNVFIGDKAIDIIDFLPKMTPPKLPERALKLRESLNKTKELTKASNPSSNIDLAQNQVDNNNKPTSYENKQNAEETKQTSEKKDTSENKVSETNNKHSIQFCILDKNGNKCDGMYYTIKVNSTKKLITGETDNDGCTERVFSNLENDKAYLYIGHRQENFDDLLTTRSTEEHMYDEFILNYDPVDNQIMTPFQENQQNKICEISTNRLWKPWKISEKGQKHLINVEGFILNPYLDSEGHATIGVGHLIHHGNFIMNDEKINKVIKAMKDKKPPEAINISNIKNSIADILKISGDELTNAKKEMDFLYQLTKETVIEYYKKILQVIHTIYQNRLMYRFINMNMMHL